MTWAALYRRSGAGVIAATRGLGLRVYTRGGAVVALDLTGFIMAIVTSRRAAVSKTSNDAPCPATDKGRHLPPFGPSPLNSSIDDEWAAPNSSAISAIVGAPSSYGETRELFRTR